MRIGENVFAVQPGRRWGVPSNNEENGPDGGSRRRPNDIMCVLTERAIRVSGTVCVEMQNLDSSAENQQEGEEGNEHNPDHGIRCPYSAAQSHN